MTTTAGVERDPDSHSAGSTPARQTTAPGRAAKGHWFAFGAANLAVVVTISLATWYLLADPTTSPWSFYPLPFNAALFWAILFIVFIGFNCEFAGFDKLAQPLRGITILVTTGIFAVAVTRHWTS